MLADKELIYVGDPMCSWCWGFAPELDEVQEAVPALPLRIVLGGLRPGPAAEPMSEQLGQTLRHHWEQVASSTGQIFDTALLERLDWTYDTEPACRAVVTVREIDPARTFDVFKAIQSAFYTKGIIPDAATIPELVTPLGIDRDEFIPAFLSEHAVQATWADFRLARSWGINGFPSLLYRVGDRAEILTRGYMNRRDLVPLVRSKI